MNGCRSWCHSWCRARGSSGCRGAVVVGGVRARRSSSFTRAVLRDRAVQQETRAANDTEQEPIHHRHSVKVELLTNLIIQSINSISSVLIIRNYYKGRTIRRFSNIVRCQILKENLLLSNIPKQ